MLKIIPLSPVSGFLFLPSRSTRLSGPGGRGGRTVTDAPQSRSVTGENTEIRIIRLDIYLLKDFFNLFLHPSQVKESNSSFSK